MDAKIDDLGRRASRTFALGVFLLSAACKTPVPEPSAPVAPAARSTPSARPSTAPPASPGCSLGEAHALESLETAPPVLGVAFNGANGLVVHPSGTGALVTIPIDASGQGRTPRTSPFPTAGGLVLVASMGEGFVVITEGPCADAHVLCLSAGRFDTMGAPLASPLVVPGHARISRIRRHAEDRAVLIAFSTGDGPPWVDTFVARGAGLEHARTMLGKIPRDDKEDDVLAITGTPSDFAVLHRIGSAEDPEGRLVLETARAAHPIEALEEAAMIERFVRAGREHVIVASFEFDRPLAVHIGPDGSLVGSPLRLTRESPIDASLGARESAVLRDEGAHLELLVRDVAGDILSRTRVATRDDGHALAASVARTASGFLVPFVTADHERVTLRARTVDCSSRGSR
jgi:hypothetical protein